MGWGESTLRWPRHSKAWIVALALFTAGCSGPTAPTTPPVAPAPPVGPLALACPANLSGVAASDAGANVLFSAPVATGGVTPHAITCVPAQYFKTSS